MVLKDEMTILLNIFSSSARGIVSKIKIIESQMWHRKYHLELLAI